MRQEKRSTTAEGAASLRALHQVIDDDPKILVDPLAAKLVSGPRRLSLLPYALGGRLHRQWRQRLSVAFPRASLGVRRTRAEIVTRSRYTEDRLELALEKGVDQLVILAAGLDTLALRRPDLRDRLAIFEVDHPATQAWKLERLAHAGLEPPPNLTLVPLDFENNTLEEALSQSRYDPGRPAFFSWLGVTYYLTLDAIESTLRFIARQAPGSEIVFDYWNDDDLESPRDRALLAAIRAGVAMQGEPIETCLSKADLDRLLAALNLRCLEHLVPTDVHRRYLEDRHDGLVWPEFAHLAAVSPPEGEVRQAADR